MIEHAFQFIILNLPGAYFLGMFDLTRRFLNCFKTTWVPMLCQVMIIALHLFWCHLFVNRLEWDLKGLAMAQNLTSFTMFLSATIIANCDSATKHALV